MRVGPINAQARDVLEMLTDHERCRVVLVTLPEETPVNELVDTAFSLEDRVGVGLGPVVVNGLYDDAARASTPTPAAAADGRRRHAARRRGRRRCAAAAAFRRDRIDAAGRAGRPARRRSSRCPSSACRSCSPPSSARPSSTRLADRLLAEIEALPEVV